MYVYQLTAGCNFILANAAGVEYANSYNCTFLNMMLEHRGDIYISQFLRLVRKNTPFGFLYLSI
jgi:hypothetical protein